MTRGPVRPDDRVSDVLARDEALVGIFVDASPAFARLLNPAMRRVMPRLVTVRQAARIASVDVDALLGRLNAALGVAGTDAAPATAATPDPRPDPGAAPGPVSSSASRASAHAGPHAAGAGPDVARPPALDGIDTDHIVELDVREDLRAGREPFARIMAAKRLVPAPGALRLRAIFEPVPLYAVLAKQGFDHWTERHAEDDWTVWFYRAAEADPAEADPAEANSAVARPAPAAGAGRGVRDGDGDGDGDGDDVVILDVRGLEPPEPMVRTLAALDALPRGATLVQINVREPRFLLPQLAERGFRYEVREQSEGLVRVLIRHDEGD